MMKNKKERLMIYCDYCNFKKIIENEEDLVESKRSSFQREHGYIDKQTGKFTPSKSDEKLKIYKCPKCGRGVPVKSIQKPYLAEIQKREKIQEANKMLIDSLERIKDGTPSYGERKKDEPEN